MLTITEGIVLKTQKYSEADLIVTFLTPCRGIIKTFAKSPRKTKSRFGSCFEPLTYTRITLWGKEQSMPKITHSDILQPFQNLRENFNDFIYISKLIEILISVMPEGIPNKKIFSFFLNIIKLIGAAKQEKKAAMYLISQIRLLVMLGYAPRLNGCGKCGGDSLDFYPASGTTLCKKCAATPVIRNRHFIKITGNIENFYSHALRWSLRTSSRLSPHPKIISVLSYLLDEHLIYLLDKKLQTSEFITKV